MRLCKNCKWARPVSRFDLPLGWGDTRWEYATCSNPQSILIDRVTGGENYCSVERGSYAGCGRSAKWFEPRQGTTEYAEIEELEALLEKKGKS